MDKFDDLARGKGHTSSQLVLAWLLEQIPRVFVIPGTKKIKYLEENVGGSRVTGSQGEEQELRRLVLEAGVEGGRDPKFGNYLCRHRSSRGMSVPGSEARPAFDSAACMYVQPDQKITSPRSILSTFSLCRRSRPC